jgi:hypothetical protein
MIRPLIALLLFILVAGCANDYELLQEHFYANQNLEALQTAEKGLRNDKQKTTIDAFLTKFGDRMASRALKKGKDLLENSQPKDGLEYLKELEATLDGLIELNSNVDIFKKYQSQLHTLLPLLQRNVVAAEETLGSEAFRNGDYIPAVYHFRNVLEFEPDRTDIQDLLETALEKGQRHMVITKFYAHSKSIPTAFSDEFKALINKDSHSRNELAENALIRGVNVTDTLRHDLVDAFNALDNEFISSGISPRLTTSKNIKVQGIITAYEEDTEFTPERKLITSQLRYQYEDEGLSRWNYAPFEYAIYEVRFSVHFSVSLQLIYNGTVIDTLTITDTTEDFQRYKGDEIYWNTPPNVITVEYPPEYERLLDISLPIDKEFVIKEGIERCAKKVAKEITRRLQQESSSSKQSK